MKNLNNYGFLSISIIGALLIGCSSTILHGYFSFAVACIGFLIFTYGICKGIKERMDAYKQSKEQTDKE